MFACNLYCCLACRCVTVTLPLSSCISAFFPSCILDTYFGPSGAHLSVSYLSAFSYCSWGSRGKNTEVVCHSLLQWTTFGLNSPPRPVRLGWPHTAWLVASLSYTGLWSTWSQLVWFVWLVWLVWLVSCDCGFHSGGCGIVVLASSICPLMDEDKKPVQASDGRDRLWGKLGLALEGRPRSGCCHVASLPQLPLALPRVSNSLPRLPLALPRLSLSLFSFSYKTTSPVG